MLLVKSAILLVLLVCLYTIQGHARPVLFQDPQQEARPNPTQDPISQLRLTAEQRQKIRAIRSQNKDERAIVNQRLREANFALEQALESDNPNEADVEQLLRNVAAAQAASMRMRVFTELQIRRVLTPEQLQMLRVLRGQAAGRRPSVDNPRPQGVDGLRQNQRNGMSPLFPRRNPLPRNPRP